MDANVIELRGVSKWFRRGRRGLLGRILPRQVCASRARGEHGGFYALREVSLSIRRGESVGVIGANGAGKSTLLKLLGGILRPDCGQMEVRGRSSALIELGAGFHGELTGRENIYLNGIILGMSRREVRAKLDAIVSFSGIAEFLDMPVKHYSSGMYARLGFAIAAHSSPDILLVDEVLSVGDAVYRVKCLDRMGELVQRGTTLLFVTHDLDQVRCICPRTLVLQGGRIIADGPSDDVTRAYMQTVATQVSHRPADLCGGASGCLRVESFQICLEPGREGGAVRSGEPFSIQVCFGGVDRPMRIVCELNLRGTQCGQVASLNSGRDGATCQISPNHPAVTLKIESLPVSGGDYLWNVRVWEMATDRLLVDTPFCFPMQIEARGPKSGLVQVPREWIVSEDEDEMTSALEAIDGVREATHAHLSAC